MSTVAFLSDIHFPEHHKQAWDLTLKILSDLNVDRIHIGGDGIEFESLSRFEVPPNRRLELKNDVAITLKELTKLRRAVPNAPMEWRCGNHEWRMNRFIYAKAPELDGIKGISVPEVFEFSNFDIEWLPSDRRREIGKLNFIHGDEPGVSGGVRPARAIYQKVGGNVICGHFHARDSYFYATGDGNDHGAWVTSCLRTLRPGWAKYAQWTTGFSVVNFSKSGFFNVDEILYLKRGDKLWAKVEGVEYTG